MMTMPPLVIRQGRKALPYEPIWRQMQTFTENRKEDTPDECWILEHEPVFTQGQAGKAEHLLVKTPIPVIQTDRGGQITYHGPGQCILYPLLDLNRLKLSIRDLVCKLEKSLIACLNAYGIEAHLIDKAPGVYVKGDKIASLGLRVKRGCTYHGLALNVAMDLSPFSQINPCGYAKLKMTDIQAFQTISMQTVQSDLIPLFMQTLGYHDSIQGSPLNAGV